jgi:hypothetical protein
LDELYLSYTGYGVSNAWQTVSGLLQSSGSVSVAIGGGSSNVPLVSGEAYLDNFEVATGAILGWPLVTDFDGDGFIDVNDLVEMAQHWLESGAGIISDLDSDGSVDMKDFSIFGGTW